MAARRANAMAIASLIRPREPAGSVRHNLRRKVRRTFRRLFLPLRAMTTTSISLDGSDPLLAQGSRFTSSVIRTNEELEIVRRLRYDVYIAEQQKGYDGVD